MEPARLSRIEHAARLACGLMLIAGIIGAVRDARAQQIRVEAISDAVTGRAPVIAIGAITNESAPARPPTTGHALRASALVDDPDLDAIGTTTYRWLRNGTQVATGPTYTPTSADATQGLSLEVSATTDAMTTDPANATNSTAVTLIQNSPPIAHTARITGLFGAAAVEGPFAVVGTSVSSTWTFGEIDQDAMDEAAVPTSVVWCNGTCGVGTQRNLTIAKAHVGEPLYFRITPVSMVEPKVGEAVSSESVPVFVISEVTSAGQTIGRFQNTYTPDHAFSGYGARRASRVYVCIKGGFHLPNGGPITVRLHAPDGTTYSAGATGHPFRNLNDPLITSFPVNEQIEGTWRVQVITSDITLNGVLEITGSILYMR